MKISNSKQELARIISENGGWRDGAEFSALEESAGDVWFCKEKPKYKIGLGIFSFNDFIGAIDGGFEFANWHQTILSRAEYFHLYPAPDADGWIEWSGGECPAERGVMVDIKDDDGYEWIGVKALGCIECERDFWVHALADSENNIIAYRLHKPKQAKSSAVGDDETKEELEAIELSESSEVRANLAKIYAPSIESLATDYRNKLDYADRKRDEADKAKVESDAALSELEKAIAEIGFAITPIGAAAQEPELVITDWRDLLVGDEVEYCDGAHKYMIGEVGTVAEIDNRDGGRPIRIASDKISEFHSAWPVKWRFIRRP